MSMLTLSIAPTLKTSFPSIMVQAFCVSGLRAAATAVEKQPVDFAKVGIELAESGLSIQNLTEDLRIRGWREAIAKCGLKPSTFKTSAEQLVKRILAGSGISTPLPLVTGYCAISARHVAPLGAYDLARLPARDIVLREAAHSDQFSPLGGRVQDMPLLPSVAVYAAGDVVMCYAFNHRDSSTTCLTAETEDAVFIGEAVELTHREPLQRAFEELRTWLERCGATLSPTVVCTGPRVAVQA